MPMRFDGKVALVTGGGAGIGRAHAHALAARGAKVVIFDYGIGPLGDVNPADSGREFDAAEEIVALGGEAIGIAADVTDDAQVRDSVRQALDHFGRIDILINNAGTAEVRDTIQEAPTHHFDRQIDIHVRGTLRVTREIWPSMEKNGYGRIILTGSAASLGHRQTEGYYVAGYAVAKSALFGAMRQLAGAGVQAGIQVNMIMPWSYSRLLARTREGTPFGEWMKRKMRPEQVAAGALYLVHDSCAVTGEIISIGGGRVARMIMCTPPGLFKPDLEPEDVRDHWDEVMGRREEFAELVTCDTEWLLLQNLVGSAFE